MNIDIKRVWVTWMVVGRGFTQYTAFCEECPGPIGMVWGIGFGAGDIGKSRFEVWGSFVPPLERRKGVRKKINEILLQHFDTIITQNGTDEGAKFMRSNGYIRDKRLGIWYLTRRRV